MSKGHSKMTARADWSPSPGLGNCAPSLHRAGLNHRSPGEMCWSLRALLPQGPLLTMKNRTTQLHREGQQARGKSVEDHFFLGAGRGCPEGTCLVEWWSRLPHRALLRRLRQREALTARNERVRGDPTWPTPKSHQGPTVGSEFREG